ncbi:ABC transporter ATP-binding protein [Brevibacillus reuszeri]|uniref:ABC transporter ATP-binding protein n=1 Tax=Brevibacillus reuszeri TaxID=54915 RepID=UPI002896C7FB|nr:ABC transporter ATP-binding protein [Brevibacillus reuszeri]
MGETVENILEIKNLHVHYVTEDSVVKAVNGVNLEIKKGDSLGIVGETGAGKTTTALSIIQLIPDPPGIIVDGEILYKGKNLIHNTEKENKQLRGNGISMIFQDSMTALNPIMRVGEQLTEAVMTHKKVGKKEAKRQVIDLLETVGVKADRYSDYPHQFSGGMKQRVLITMALLCNPELLIADEPTTALDVTIQAQVLELMKQLREQYSMSLILISHDLGVVAQTCNRVAIMYAGEIVEIGTVQEVYTNPKHPYTMGLFESIPKLEEDKELLYQIEGSMANPAALPTGCFFHPRCKYKEDICETISPAWQGEAHLCKCHFQVRDEVKA